MQILTTPILARANQSAIMQWPSMLFESMFPKFQNATKQLISGERGESENRLAFARIQLNADAPRCSFWRTNGGFWGPIDSSLTQYNGTSLFQGVSPGWAFFESLLSVNKLHRALFPSSNHTRWWATFSATDSVRVHRYFHQPLTFNILN